MLLLAGSLIFYFANATCYTFAYVCVSVVGVHLAANYFGKTGGARSEPKARCVLWLWFCMGLWHGNSWKYIIGEGLWFWLAIVSGQVCAPLLKRAVTAKNNPEFLVFSRAFFYNIAE